MLHKQHHYCQQNTVESTPHPLWVLALTDSTLCLQVTRNKAFLRDVQAVFRAAPTLYCNRRESKVRERRPPRQRLLGASLTPPSPLKRGTLVWPGYMASHWLGSHPITQRPCLCLRWLSASCQIHVETGLYSSN